MDWQNGIAIIGAIAGLIGLASSLRTARSAARKDDVDALSGIIDALQEENTRLWVRIKSLEDENRGLRKDNRTLTKQLSLQIDEIVGGRVQVSSGE